MPVFLDGAQKSERIPSVSFEEYINESRSLQWDHAFVDQIKSKKINKSHKWDASKKSFGVGAMHCLIYRYWIQILIKERVVRASHPAFASWIDTNCSETMFTTDQISGWVITHLKACHWYIEMSSNATPPHEEENCLKVEPEFVPPPPSPPSTTDAPQKPFEKLNRGGKSKAKGIESSKKAVESSKSFRGDKARKRGAHAATRESSKHGKTSKGDVAQAAPDNVGESDVKSKAKSGCTFRVLDNGIQRVDLIPRIGSGASVTRMFNRTISDILNGHEKAKFEVSITDVCNNFSIYFL